MPEAADGEVRAVNGQGRNDHIHARSVGKAGVYHRRRLVHTSANSRNDLVDNVHQVRVVLEHDVALFEHSGALYVNLFGTIDQDVVDRRILEQRLQWAEAKYFVQNFQRQSLALATAQGSLEVGDQILNHGKNLCASALIALIRHSFKVHAADQIPVN